MKIHVENIILTILVLAMSIFYVSAATQALKVYTNKVTTSYSTSLPYNMGLRG